MQFSDFKNEAKKIQLGINKEYGKILSLIDFGNVDYWYEKDRRDGNNNELDNDEKLNVGIEKLFNFCQIFSNCYKFYYGLDQRRKKSIHIINLARSNFDVEICIDAIRLMDKYETLCLFSSDADFISLFKFVKNQGKKIILVKGGYTQTELIKKADLIIQAQDIKSDLTIIKQKSRP